MFKSSFARCGISLVVFSILVQIWFVLTPLVVVHICKDLQAQLVMYIFFMMTIILIVWLRNLAKNYLVDAFFIAVHIDMHNSNLSQ